MKAQYAHASEVRLGVHPLEPDVLPLFRLPRLQGHAGLEQGPQLEEAALVLEVLVVVADLAQGLDLAHQALVVPDLAQAPAQGDDEPGTERESVSGFAVW